MKRIILEDNQLPNPSPTDRSTPSTPSSAPLTSSSTGDPCLLSLSMPQDQMILMSMALLYLLPLPLVFVYSLHIILFSLKNSSMKKSISHQNDVICFRSSIINEWLWLSEKLLKTRAHRRRRQKIYWGWAAHNHRSLQVRRNSLPNKGSRCKTT